MTDDLNRLRADQSRLTDEEAALVADGCDVCEGTGSQVATYDKHMNPKTFRSCTWCKTSVVESIVAARTAALLDRIERAEAERAALAATCDLFGLPHSATALQRHITNNWAAIRNADASTIRILVARTDAVASFADQLERTTESHNQWIVNELRSLLAAAPTETEGTPDE